MPSVTELDLPVLDYTDPELRGERFHDRMRELRARGWIAAAPFGFVVLEREAVEFFLRSKATTFPGMTIAALMGIEDGPLYEEMRRNIIHINGADHARLRQLVNPFFTPRAAERHRPAMREFLERLWADVRGAGRCDAVDALAKPYPALTIARVLGAPEADAPRLHHWSNWVQRQFDAGSLMTERAEIEQAVVEVYAYLEELLAARRADPADDLTSMLLAAEAEGDRLTDVECLNLVLDVLLGGVDTTQAQLAHGLRLFCEHPDQWALLGERPELVPQAVEEVLRFAPITPFTARITLEDVEFRDVSFPAGTILMVAAVTGNREPGVIAEPERFDITADRGRAKPLTFGAGIHFCLGANLARAELQEAFAFLAPRMRGLELDGEPAYESVTGIYGLAELPVRFAA
jgi:cytochrome P450